jgi:hypothetical protein
VNRLIIATTIAIVALGNASPANAQRDAGDRGLRLEQDQLRNDVAQDRLKQRQDTVLPQSPQAQPAPNPDRKSKRSKQQN